MAVTEGNGTFVTTATAGNAGNGVIAGGTLVDPAQWVPGDYTLRFTSATGDYEILDGRDSGRDRHLHSRTAPSPSTVRTST